MITIKTNSVKDVLIHLGIILSIVAIFFLGFFFIYLPITTNQGETITVPNLAGMTVEELNDFLTTRELRYEVDDSDFVVNAKPNTVLTQYPKAGAKVKEGRKIYLKVTTSNAPMIDMPLVVGISLRSAQTTLQSFGLQLGKITYKPDLAQNVVLEQRYSGKEINKGTKVPKGAKIDLIVGDGLGNTEFDVPSVVGMPLADAEVYLKGVDLQVGTITYQSSPDQPAGTVIKQNPPSLEGNKIRIGEAVDLWVVGDPNASNRESDEDDN